MKKMLLNSQTREKIHCFYKTSILVLAKLAILKHLKFVWIEKRNTDKFRMITQDGNGLNWKLTQLKQRAISIDNAWGLI